MKSILVEEVSLKSPRTSRFALLRQLASLAGAGQFLWPVRVRKEEASLRSAKIRSVASLRRFAPEEKNPYNLTVDYLMGTHPVELYLEYIRNVIRKLGNYQLDGEDLDDLCQTVTTRILTNRRFENQPTKPEWWIYSTCQSVYHDWLRSRARHPTVHLDEELAVCRGASADGYTGVNEWARGLQDDPQASVASLDVLRLLDAGCLYEEVATTLHSSKSSIMRCVQRMRDSYYTYYIGGA